MTAFENAAFSRLTQNNYDSAENKTTCLRSASNSNLLQYSEKVEVYFAIVRLCLEHRKLPAFWSRILFLLSLRGIADALWCLERVYRVVLQTDVIIIAANVIGMDAVSEMMICADVAGLCMKII